MTRTGSSLKRRHLVQAAGRGDRDRTGRFPAGRLVPRLRASRAVAVLAFLAAGLAVPRLEAADEVPPDHAQKMAQGLELFRNQVRGLLVERCVECHGGKKTEGELDLTTREGLLAGGGGGPAVVPYSARESRLYQLITHAEEPHMPFEAEKLPDEAIAHLAAWIDAGAPYDRPLADRADSPEGKSTVTDEDRRFWSFQPLKRAPPPPVADESWCRTPIDRFVLARLQAAGLAPSPPADRRRLIRRASFDLVGLPPTPEEVESFVNDPAPDAYERLIDRLLASPHYGERWGRHWLDLARFAESHGYEQDYDRPSAYHYRDFVIQAFNEDLPYDRFVKLQIAGDELEPDDPQAMMATGFLAAGTHATQITANQAEKERYDELDDMAATIGTSMLGLTIGCARCHDHKFDPLPQRDYYRVISTFTTTVRSEIDLDLHPERYRQAKAEFDRQHAPLALALARFDENELPARLEEWLKNDGQPPEPRWLVLDLVSSKSDGGATFTRQDDGSYLAAGAKAKSDTYTFVAHTPLAGITAVRLEALVDPSLPKGGPGRADNGNFALSDFRLSAAPLDGQGEPVPVKLVDPKATFEQNGLAVAAAIDQDPASAWAVDPRFGQDHAAVFELETPVGYDAGTVLAFTLSFANNDGHHIGRPRLSVSAAPRPVGLDGDQAPQDLVVEIRRILKTPADQRTEQDHATLLAWYGTIDRKRQELKRAVDQHLQQAPKPEMTKVLVSSEGLPAVRLHTQGPDFYEKTYFLKRGDLQQKQEEATPGFLDVLMAAPEQDGRWRVQPPEGCRTSYRRLALANWITDAECGAGHLLARVIINRLWQHYFGRGIVATPSDFGAQGQHPTHPELLDWLALQLVRQDWKLKPLHKLIMTSAVYMQAAQYDAARAAVDPDNALLWRQSWRRLEAEVIRDAMLAVGGAIDERMFGPGTLDEGQRRRSIYLTVKRSQLIGFLVLFDAPEPNQGMPARSSTTIAPQALAMINSPHVRAWARGFARRIAPQAGASPAEAVRWAYLIALGREPAQDELADTVAFLERQSESYRAGGKPDALELALADVCQALVSLNEFVYIE